jgi:hypothetical protein
MFDIDDTIDAFRRGTLDFDCKRIVLAQRKEGGERFEGQGYVRQSTDGTLEARCAARNPGPPVKTIRRCL